MGIKQRKQRREDERAADPEGSTAGSLDTRIRKLRFENAVRHQILRDSLSSMSPVVLIFTLYLAYKAETRALLAFQLANSLLVALSATYARGRSPLAVTATTVAVAVAVSAAWLFLRAEHLISASVYPIGSLYFALTLLASTLVTWMERQQAAKLRVE